MRAPEKAYYERRAGGDREEVQERKLSDGSHHHVYKRWFSAASLADELDGEALFDGDWFVAARA